MESAIIDPVSPIPEFECVTSQTETHVSFTLVSNISILQK